MTNETIHTTEYEVLDPANLGMHLNLSGVRVSSCGEDGDVLLMGHHDDQTAFALFAEHNRYENGEELSLADAECYDIRRIFGTFSNHSEGCELIGCECESDDVCAECRTLDHESCDGQACLCADDYDHDRPAEWPCSCECNCDECAWWFAETTTGHEVTWVHFSWDKYKAREQRSRDDITKGSDA